MKTSTKREPLKMEIGKVVKERNNFASHRTKLPLNLRSNQQRAFPQVLTTLHLAAMTGPRSWSRR